MDERRRFECGMTIIREGGDKEEGNEKRLKPPKDSRRVLSLGNAIFFFLFVSSFVLCSVVLFAFLFFVLFFRRLI